MRLSYLYNRNAQYQEDSLYIKMWPSMSSSPGLHPTGPKPTVISGLWAAQMWWAADGPAVAGDPAGPAAVPWPRVVLLIASHLAWPGSGNRRKSSNTRSTRFHGHCCLTGRRAHSISFGHHSKHISLINHKINLSGKQNLFLDSTKSKLKVFWCGF